MAEYIKREALQAALQRKKAGAANARYTDGWNDCLMRCKSMVSRFPAADVAPVVRCKDCQYWQDNNGGYPNEECRWREDETPDADDFCSYGKRKDGDSNKCSCCRRNQNMKDNYKEEKQ